MEKMAKRGCGVLILTVALALSAHAQTFITNGLIAYYPFQGNASDASGNGHNLTINSGATLTADRFGNPNSAYNFNRAYMQCAGIPLNLAGPYSVSLWMNLNAYNFYDVVLGLTVGTDCDSNPTIYEADSSVTLNQCGSPSVGQVFGTAGALVGGWHQLVFVVATNRLDTVYTDGQVTSSVGLSWPASTNILLTLGATGSNLGQECNASLDDVRLYNRALSTSEVTQLYGIESRTIVFTQNLTNESVVAGQNTAFSVAATSALPLTYQWYFSGTNPPNLAGAYAQIISGFVYGTVVTNGGYGYGNVPPVTFVGGGGTGASGYATVSNGVVAGITVTNAGTGYASPPTVVIGAPDGLILGQTNSTLNIYNASLTNAGSYYVVAANGGASVTSSVVSLTVFSPPAITANPAGFTQGLHSSNSLSVAASGTPPLNYQWMLNGANLPGATNSSYIISNLLTNNLGNYTVEITNAYGEVFSSMAAVAMTPSLAAPFAGAVGLWGQPLALSVGAVGSGILDYQWYFNGVPIADATGSSYELSSIQFTNAGLYSVVVSSAYGSVTNLACQVVVNSADYSLGMYPGITITGTPGYVYSIQGSSDLSDTNKWVTLTNLTLAAPVELWFDAGANASPPTNRYKFYQVIPGQ